MTTTETGQHRPTVIDLGDKFTIRCDCGWEQTAYRMGANPPELWAMHLRWTVTDS